MRDLPSGRVPEQGPDWFLVATEACGGGTPDLAYFLEVSVFIGIFGVGFTSGGLRAVHEIGAHAQGGGRAPTLMDSPGLFSPNYFTPGLLLVHKKSSKIGTSIGLRLVFLSCKTQNKGKKQKLALGLRLVG